MKSVQISIVVAAAGLALVNSGCTKKSGEAVDVSDSATAAVEASAQRAPAKRKRRRAKAKRAKRNQLTVEQRTLRLFAGADADKDGKLTLAELTAKAKTPEAKEKRTSWFKKLDGDADESVTPEEASKFFSAMRQQQIEKTFNKQDLNKDGEVTMDELAKVIKRAKRLERAKQQFSRRDANKDGKLTLQEFSALP